MSYAVRMKCTTGTQTGNPALSEDSLITVSMLKTVLSILLDLQKKVNYISAVYKDTDAIGELNELRPVKTLEELDELEKRASCENFVWAVVNSLGRVHGKDRHIGNGRPICMQLVDKFFDQDFLGDCTWSNALEKGKIALVDFEKTLSLLYQTVLYSDPEFTTIDMRNILQNCMQTATAEREQGNGGNAVEPNGTTTPKGKPQRRKQNQRKVRGKQNQNLPAGPADSPMVCIDLSDDSEIELSSEVVTANNAQPANTVLLGYVPSPEPTVTQSLTTLGSPKDRKATSVSALVSVDYSVVPPFPNKIFSPVKSLEELCALDKKASNEGFASAVAMCLGKNHGKNTSHGKGRIVCEQLLTTFYDPSFLRQCTWTKAGNEQDRTALEEHRQTLNLYYRTVIFSAPDFTLPDFNNFMMSVVADLTSSSNKQPLVEVCVAGPADGIGEEIIEIIEEETRVATQEATSEPDTTALESMNIDNLIETVHIDETEADFLFDQFIEEQVVHEEYVAMIQEEDVSEHSFQEAGSIDLIEDTEVASEASKDTSENSISQRTRSKIFVPVTCLEELEELEKNARNDAFVLSVVTCLGRVHEFKGKGDAKMVCQRLINKFFDETFLRQCCWIGKHSDKAKICLANYSETINLFYQTVRFTDPDFTKLRAKAFISRLLKQYNTSPEAEPRKRRKSKNENSIDATDEVYGQRIKTQKSDDSDVEFSYEIDYIEVPESSEVLEQLAKICYNT
ncbi:uncharacterized protein LOC128278606 [Anopheles cruzii]|uniref:uncharacterized protein LOC128278606 n=1 Tax=Anopheles cruzii TaxID=68878 RepID=UPI0022EC754E|nr:uncharacterized protein LOC128278606 [Anopheles cruzii]